MNKTIYSFVCIALGGLSSLCVGLLTSCSGAKNATEAAISVSTTMQGEQNSTLKLPVDKDGYVVLFDGTSLNGWRGYGKTTMPNRWKIVDGCLHFSRDNGSVGGDVIFAHKFKNFELELEWKVAKGSNSGIFYLGQEITTTGKDGKTKTEPLYISAPEYQVLDNENHSDAKLGHDGNRKSASLYDMLPANPQNSKPYGQWNKAKIVVKNGKVAHYQNDVKVVEYTLWTPEWTQMLQESKFSEKAWPTAFALLNNCGGDLHEGFIGLQDHGNEVWYRNIRVKILK